MLDDPARTDGNLRPDGVPVRGLADQVKANPAAGVAIVVAQEPARAAVGGEDDVQVPVAVDVGIRGAAADHGREEVGAGRFGADLNEQGAADLAGIPEELRRLGVGLGGIDGGDLGLEMAVGPEQVGVAVEVVIEPEEAELQRRLGRRARP